MPGDTPASPIVASQATVYRGGRRRYLTLRAACRRQAWVDLVAEWGLGHDKTATEEQWQEVSRRAYQYEAAFREANRAR